MTDLANRSALKGYFETGDPLSEASFINLIDTLALNSTTVPATDYQRTVGTSVQPTTVASLGPRPIYGETNLPKLWAKLGKIYQAQAWALPASAPIPQRMNWLTIGDSVAWRIGQPIGAYLQSTYGWGGIAGRWTYETGWYIISNTGTIVADPVDAYTSPFGEYIELGSGQQITLATGNTTTTGWQFGQLSTSKRLPGIPGPDEVKTNITKVEVYYQKLTGLGTFKLQYTTDGSTWIDVPGLTSINTASGASSTKTFAATSVTVSNLSILYVRAVELSGTVRIYGGGIMRDTGVVNISLSIGGAKMKPMFIGNQQFTDMIAYLAPTCVILGYLDGPDDSSTPAAWNNMLLAAWSAIAAAGGNPDIVYMGQADSSASVQDDVNETHLARAKLDGKTYLDIRRILGTYTQANANGAMADVTHPDPYMLGPVIAYFLSQTGLTASPYIIQYPGRCDPSGVDTMSIGTSYKLPTAKLTVGGDIAMYADPYLVGLWWTDGAYSNHQTGLLSKSAANSNISIGPSGGLVVNVPAGQTGTIKIGNGGNYLRWNASGLSIGGTLVGTPMQAILSATATLDFPSIAANSAATLTMTLTGAVLGDTVIINPPVGSVTTDVSFSAWVSAADTITVMAKTGATTRDPTSGVFRATLIQF